MTDENIPTEEHNSALVSEELKERFKGRVAEIAEQASANRKYEYLFVEATQSKVLAENHKNLEQPELVADYANRVGKNGWELVAITPLRQVSQLERVEYAYALIFKRIRKD